MHSTSRRFLPWLLLALLLPACGSSNDAPDSATDASDASDSTPNPDLSGAATDTNDPENSIDDGTDAPPAVPDTDDTSAQLTVPPAAPQSGATLTFSGAGYTDEFRRAGDINGDGLGDMMVTREDQGTGLVYGRVSGWPDGLNEPGESATTAFPELPDPESFEPVGDINGDGFDDLVGIAPFFRHNNSDYRSSAVVLFGSAAGIASDLTLDRLDGTNGYVMLVPRLDVRIADVPSVSGLGDIDGDGLDDVALNYGFTLREPESLADAYIVYGTRDAQPAVRDSSLAAPGEITGLNVANDLYGNEPLPADYVDTDTIHLQIELAGIGDVNGDGLADLAVNLENLDRATVNTHARSFVVFGRRQRSELDTRVSDDIVDSPAAMVIDASDNPFYIYRTRALNDLNGDGIDDFAISRADSPAQVIYGSTDLGGVIDLANTESLGIRIESSRPFPVDVIDVAGTLDIDNDGRLDLLVNTSSNPNAADYYDYEHGPLIIYGGAEPLPATLDLHALGDVAHSRVVGTEAAGFLPGDVNGDGIEDLGIEFQLETINTAIVPTDDLDGDGMEDVLIGPAVSEFSRKAYLVFGFDGISTAPTPEPEMPAGSVFVSEQAFDEFTGFITARGIDALTLFNTDFDQAPPELINDCSNDTNLSQSGLRGFDCSTGSLGRDSREITWRFTRSVLEGDELERLEFEHDPLRLPSLAPDSKEASISYQRGALMVLSATPSVMDFEHQEPYQCTINTLTRRAESNAHDCAVALFSIRDRFEKYVSFDF